jgi:hypothetical protein
MFLLNLVLAVNRLCVVVKMNVLKQFGEGQLGWERALYRVRAIGTYLITVMGKNGKSALGCLPMALFHTT